VHGDSRMAAYVAKQKMAAATRAAEKAKRQHHGVAACNKNEKTNAPARQASYHSVA